MFTILRKTICKRETRPIKKKQFFFKTAGIKKQLSL